MGQTHLLHRRIGKIAMEHLVRPVQIQKPQSPYYQILMRGTSSRYIYLQIRFPLIQAHFLVNASNVAQVHP
jgi:hypothetical protein